MRQYILTIKLPRDANHDPRSKAIGNCITSPNCTDKTGAHHSLLVNAMSVGAVELWAKGEGYHITRIERVITVINA